MAGEIAGVNYGAMNDDFLAQMYFNKMAQNAASGQQTQTNPVSQTGANPAFQGGEKGDTFERSSAPTAAATVVGGGGAAGAGYYFAKPVNKEGELAEGLVQAMNKQQQKMYTEMATKKLLAEAKKPVLETLEIADEKTYNAIKKLSTAAKLEDLTPAEQALIPDKYKLPSTAKDAVDLAEAEFKKIDMTKIQDEVKAAVKEIDLKSQVKLLGEHKILEGKIAALADDVAEADLTKLIKENKALFNLSGTEDEIAAQAAAIAKKGKAGVAADVKAALTTQDEWVKGIRQGMKEGFLEHFDDTTKALKKDAPEFVQKALKNFKWKQAGIWGAAAAGTALVLGALFGGGKKQA